MGEIYKARHRRLNKLVALKLVPNDSPNPHGATARFQREMQAVGDLDHPNVVEAYDAGEQAGVVYLAMKLIDGVDLDVSSSNKAHCRSLRRANWSGKRRWDCTTCTNAA